MATTVNIIGSGIGGLATAIRLAANGYVVIVFEKNERAGGKLAELKLGNYRFDKGPSLLTLPHLIDDLTKLSAYDKPFKYSRLKSITHYFFEDGTRLKAEDSIEQFAKELHEKVGEDQNKVLAFFRKSAFYYDTTADLFLNQSLSRIKNFLNLKTLRGIWRAPRLKLARSMDQVNKQFKSEKTRQIFNRYATYNGSNPYKAPALLNIIPNLEFQFGAYFPEKGMYQITEHLYEMALFCGVSFQFNSTVEKIKLEKNRTKGVWADGKFYKSDLIVSNSDMHFTYSKLLPKSYSPKKILQQEKSSSAYVFYWGIKKEFKELGLHNILFSQNYEEEFSYLFEKDVPYHDPTIYINISSKYCKSDAPEGCENWFVMVNVPHRKESAAITYGDALRKQVVTKINRILNCDIESYIEVESVLNPLDIETQTSSYGGSLYGNSSNSKFSAFRRHSNFSKNIKGLYFAGGSVHPGGGIPLCLLSGKITADLIEEKVNV